MRLVSVSSVAGSLSNCGIQSFRTPRDDTNQARQQCPSVPTVEVKSDRPGLALNHPVRNP